MENSTALTQPNNGNQAVAIANKGQPLVVASIATLPLAEAEAELVTEFDRLQQLSNEDPLEALNQVLGVLQGINFELMKSIAPPVIENAQADAAEYHANGKQPEGRRGDSKALNSMLRVQDSIMKLGVARVKVRDELRRRRGER